MAEVLINLDNRDSESRRLASHDYARHKMTPMIKISKVEEKIKAYGKVLDIKLEEYHGNVRKLEKIIEILNSGNMSITSAPGNPFEATQEETIDMY